MHYKAHNIIKTYEFTIRIKRKEHADYQIRKQEENVENRIMLQKIENVDNFCCMEEATKDRMKSRIGIMDWCAC